MTPSSPYGPPADPGPPVRSSRRRMRRRRMRRHAVLLLALLAVGGAAVGLTGLVQPPARQPAASRGHLTDGSGAGAHPERGGYPAEGTGSFAAADGRSPVRGYEGPLRRYRVVVEQGAGQDVDAFAATVDDVLGDRRSWIGSDQLRIQRVPEEAAADFTIYLATPATSERLCAEGGLSTEGYTSCRIPGRVIINLARWMDSVPDYGAPLVVYRTYVINHEVGHEFGEEHQACPGPGEPAPVMQQQTYGLDGCVANAWPYVDGQRYAGELVDGI